MKRPLLAAAALAVAFGLQAATAAAQTLAFSAIPDEDETRLVERFTKVADYLSKTLGVPVKYIPVKSYGAAVTAFKNNQIQLGWFGGLSGVQARRAVPGSMALAQGEEDKAFVSYFIANASTGIAPDEAKLPDAVKGKTFTFGAKTSTSGRLMPEFYIDKRFGESPEKVFSRVGFSGDHTKTVELVSTGAYQVGAVNFTTFDDMVAKKQVDPSTVRIIWKTPSYPDYNWSIRGDADKTFGAGFTAKVRAALLDMKDPALLASFPRSKFIPAQNSNYKPIEVVGEQLGLLD